MANKTPTYDIKEPFHAGAAARDRALIRSKNRVKAAQKAEKAAATAAEKKTARKKRIAAEKTLLSTVNAARGRKVNKKAPK